MVGPQDSDLVWVGAGWWRGLGVGPLRLWGGVGPVVPWSCYMVCWRPPLAPSLFLPVAIMYLHRACSGTFGSHSHCRLRLGVGSVHHGLCASVLGCGSRVGLGLRLGVSEPPAVRFSQAVVQVGGAPVIMMIVCILTSASGTCTHKEQEPTRTQDTSTRPSLSTIVET